MAEPYPPHLIIIKNPVYYSRTVTQRTARPRLFLISGILQAKMLEWVAIGPLLDRNLVVRSQR